MKSQKDKPFKAKKIIFPGLTPEQVRKGEERLLKAISELDDDDNDKKAE